MGLTLITPPVAAPISLSEVKAHLRVVTTSEDSLISVYIAAAVANLDGKDGWLGRCLVAQTWDLILDSFPPDAIQIPLSPVQSVTGVYYYDSDGIEQTLSADNYTVDTASEPGWVVLNEGSWPSVLDGVNAVRVRFVAGWPMNSDSPPVPTTPAAIKAAIMLIVGDLYENRQGQTVQAGTMGQAINPTVQALLRPYKVNWVF